MAGRCARAAGGDAFISAVASLLPVAACRSLAGTERWGRVSFRRVRQHPAYRAGAVPGRLRPGRARLSGGRGRLRAVVRIQRRRGACIRVPGSERPLRWLRTAWFVPVGFLFGFAVLRGLPVGTRCVLSSLSGLRLRSTAPAGRAVPIGPFFHCIGPLCASKMGPSVLALPLGSLDRSSPTGC